MRGMSTSAYHFSTTWRVRATLAEVNAILGNAADLPRWWPAVYLAVEQIHAGDPESGVGRVIRLFTKGWLPYTLRWQFEVVSSRNPNGFVLEARGDFDGRGEWTFVQDGEHVNIVYDWRINANKPLLKALTPVLRPLFSANHRWAMRTGLQSLELELRRHRAKTAEERAAIPEPPQPTFTRRRQPASTPRVSA